MQVCDPLGPLLAPEGQNVACEGRPGCGVRCVVAIAAELFQVCGIFVFPAWCAVCGGTGDVAQSVPAHRPGICGKKCLQVIFANQPSARSMVLGIVVPVPLG